MQRAAFTAVLLIGTLAGCLSAFLPATSAAQDDTYLEEIVLTFQVRRLLSTDLFVQYDGKSVYLPLMEVFDLLDLKIERDATGRVFRGFVISQSEDFEIDLASDVVQAPTGTARLTPRDYIKSETDLYLRIDLFETFFELPMKFEFSALRVTLPLNPDFPAYQKLQRSLEHKRLLQEKEKLGDIKHLPYRRAMLGGATADWNISATPFGGGTQYFNLNMGAMVGGGDLTASATGNSETGVPSDQLSYRWHYFVDTAGYVTQFEAGDIFTGMVGGPLSRSLRGASVTNKPQTQREYFRTLTVDGYLGEGWEVELWVDQKLVDFMTTGQSGRYDFDVDIYYGASVLTLKMYGPNGEIRTEERYVRVPYMLIPERTMEYTLTVGQAYRDTLDNWYGQASAFYGIRRNLSLGGMADIPISATSDEPPAWAAEATYQPFGNLTVTGSYAPDYTVEFDINYNKPGLISLDGSVSTYFENEYRNRLRRQNSAVLTASAPLKIGQRRLNLRYYLSWTGFETSDQISMHYGFNTGFGKLNLYYLGKYEVNRYESRSVKRLISEAFASVSITNWLRPQVRVTYDHTDKDFGRVSLYFNKRVFRNGQLALTLERDMRSETNMVRLSFNLFTDFADFNSRVSVVDNSATYSQIQRGSIRYDQQSGKFLLERHFGVGRSTAVVRPFLDNNFNGQFDPDEEPIEGLRASVRGGRERRTGDKKIYYYDGLNPYDEHLVRIDPVSLDNPLLKPTYEGYRVPLNPNMVTTINVPMVITGEVEGMVQRQTETGLTGQGGIKVHFYHLGKESVTEITTFSNGDYFYLGLIPGRYRAYIDPDQLTRLGYRSEPEYIEFDMEAVEGGATVSNVDFVLITNGGD